ncbi:MAG: glycosyltransferase family 39 protein [Phycisphaerales bacterium]|nr:glycosyltransferase family 39 protein [Phycisphaerales bacterium]
MNDPTATPARYWPWAARPGAAFMLVAMVTLLRLVYLAWFCPYTLIEDEAHYWEWSRRLDWSYYSKGPGIAWTIRAFTTLLGESEFGVRAAAPISAGLTALGVAWLATRACNDRRAGVLAAAMILCAPMYQVMGLLLTIDGPYAACWTLGLIGIYRAIVQGRAGGWVLLGAAMGLGVLYKHTILLLAPGVLAGAIANRKALTLDRRHALAIGAGLGLLLLGLVPMTIWNAQRDWPTVRHLLGHLGSVGSAAGGDVHDASREPWSPLWTLTFIATQIGMIGPAIALMAAGTRRAACAAAAHRLLAWCALPLLAFYLGVSFITEPEGNWALAAYLSLIPLGAAWILPRLDDWHQRLLAWRAMPDPRPFQGFLLRRPETVPQVLWHATLVVGALVAIFTARLDLVARLPLVGEKVPLGRFMGADQLAAHAQRLGDELTHETGKDAFFVAMHYGRASQLAFYLPGRSVVYCSSSRMLDGRRTQYDLWAATDLSQPGLLGRPAIVIGGNAQAWHDAFDRIVEIGRLEGDRKRGRPAFKAYGYRGFPDPPAPARTP